MAQKVDEEELKRLCEQASHELVGEKLIALTTKIITLLDAKHAKLSGLPLGGRTTMAPIAENFSDGEWRRLYLAALAETDKKKLREKLYEAETAIFGRLKELSTSTAPEGERTDLDNAIRGLHVLKRDMMRFPDST